MAVRNNEELSKILGSITIANGGVMSNIHRTLLPKKPTMIETQPRERDTTGAVKEGGAWGVTRGNWRLWHDPASGVCNICATPTRYDTTGSMTRGKRQHDEKEQRRCEEVRICLIWPRISVITGFRLFKTHIGSLFVDLASYFNDESS
ncbi:hypothetical protein EZV62_018933 [Acer yangbiense]|uniref:Histone H2A C-terminal domain-containing protein n=1 Tax=Acer yangbiense TaxID=1000413 RepID=A0A5C7H9T9_9ROSI|nr:hypothetical protein EZV62_018933 [Acer yangbiense]